MQMTYEEAKKYRQQMEERHKVDSDVLKEFDKYGTGAMGLTPDHVREMPEWKKAKQACDRNFAELRRFNGLFVKTFKKEIREERRNQFK